MTTRKFFRKAHLLDKPPKQPPKPKVPKHAYHMYKAADGSPRYFNIRRANYLRGVSNGANRIHELGLAHKWTTETARAAALKLWKRRYRYLKTINARIGMPSTKRPKLNRTALRYQYAHNPTKGVQYIPTFISSEQAAGGGYWQLDTIRDGRSISRPLSERAALIRLGHLPSKRKFGTPPDLGTVAALPDTKE